METAEACDIARLPEELLAAIVSLTSPPDACRAAAVSRALRAAADSDNVWSCFLPRDLPEFAAGELSPMPSSKKAMFRRLSDHPMPPSNKISMWLDKFTGAKCYTIPARALQISWGDTPFYWRWIHVRWIHVAVPEDPRTGQRVIEAAQLLNVCWFEIRGKIQRKMMSQNTNYAAYIVFKLVDGGTSGLDYPFQEASVSVGGSKSTRRAWLQGYDVKDRNGGAVVVPRKHIVRYGCTIPIEDDVMLPRRRADGWMELELGEFCNDEDGNGEVQIGLMQTYDAKRGIIIVRGIEIRVDC